MKRLGVYAFILASTVALFGISFVSKAHAQNLPPQGTYEYFQGIVNPYFSSAETALTAIASRDASQVEPTGRFKTYLTNISSAYTSTFNQEKNIGTKPVDAQIKAIIAFNNAMQSGPNLALISNYSASAPQRTVISQLSKKMSDASFSAEQIKRNNTTAGSDESNVITSGSSTIESAAKGNTNLTVKTSADPKECSLVNGNLVGCIDAFVAWIIKKTVLQIAGFLVWLTANMLNYAIQISILGFSQWAPDTLYPIWIIIRQIVSLAVVFAGLYLGFMYIIGREDTFAKYIGWLVLFALFVNFSYPVTRAVVDVSNVVSLNVYASAVGSETLTANFASAATTLGGNTAGALIMTRLGLQGLVGSATTVAKDQGGVVDSINSTPGALITLVFVLYTAYIFFMATAIIATRTAVLVFLIVASPLLLIDSVIPKLGETAMKMRKMFFEQLVVAPVFMIMLALTLKFMEVFQGANGPLGTTSTGTLTGGADSIKTFFSILMMLIMLHIMLKVTRSLAGEAGAFATNMMGKVGGFGLGVASGGAGLLARGSIGKLAAGARDSVWMDKMKSSRMGRGMYGLTNSLAQSTFDTRNIGMVNRGMAKAGLTGIAGVGMGQGIKQGFDERTKTRREEMAKTAENIRDDQTRATYFKQMNSGLGTKIGDATMRETERSIGEKRAAQMAALAGADPAKRQSLIDMAELSKDYVLRDQLKAGNDYLGVGNTATGAAEKKAALLKRMNNDKAAHAFIENDPFKDLQKAHDEDIKRMELRLGGMKRNTEAEKAAYNNFKTAIGQAKKAHAERVEDIRKETLDAYNGVAKPPQAAQAAANAQAKPNYESDQYQKIPAVQRTTEAAYGREMSESDLERMRTAFTASSFAQNMRKGDSGATASSSSTPTSPNPKTPSPQGAAIAA